MKHLEYPVEITCIGLLFDCVNISLSCINLTSGQFLYYDCITKHLHSILIPQTALKKQEISCLSLS